MESKEIKQLDRLESENKQKLNDQEEDIRTRLVCRFLAILAALVFILQIIRFIIDLKN